MKTLRLVSIFGLLALSVFFSGCASGIINSASTKIQMNDAKGKSFALTFPKELQASGLHVSVDPQNGVIKLDADQIRSSSSTLVESAAAAQSQSISTLSNTVSQIVPILLKAASPVPVIAPEDTPAAPADPVPAK